MDTLVGKGNHGTTNRYQEGCRCPECVQRQKKYLKERYERNGERMRRAHRAYYQENKQRLIAYAVERTKQRKVELADRPKPDLCEVCGSDKRIVFDHNHETGEFRGWICDGCNKALGDAEDNPERLRKLADYLEA